MTRRFLVMSLGIVSIAGMTLIIGGCGGSGDPDAKKVEDTVIDYITDLSDEDGQGACEQLSSEEALRVFEEAVTVLPELQATSCATALSALAGSLGGEGKQALREAEVEKVVINGDSATATLIGGTTAAHLRKVGNTWLITGGLSLGG